MNSKETVDSNIKLRNKVHSRTYQAISSQSRGKEGFLRPNIHTQTHTHTHTHTHTNKPLKKSKLDFIKTKSFRSRKDLVKKIHKRIKHW